MKITIRSDMVTIDGYVNAVERKSKKLRDRVGEFFERMKVGAFKKALERNPNVRLLENHNELRDLGGTDSNVELVEDPIGLRIHAEVRDKTVIEKAQRGEYVGFSYGFFPIADSEKEYEENGEMVRDVYDLDLREVSLLDKNHIPAYDGTLVLVRDNNPMFTSLPTESDVEINNEIDYSKYYKVIEEMKGENK